MVDIGLTEVRLEGADLTWSKLGGADLSGAVLGYEGGGDRDRIWGDVGNDTLRGGGGVDLIRGEEGGLFLTLRGSHSPVAEVSLPCGHCKTTPGLSSYQLSVLIRC